MAGSPGDQDNNPKPRCIHEVLQRIERGDTTKDDADYLIEVLNRAGTRISELEMSVAWLQRQLAVRVH